MALLSLPLLALRAESNKSGHLVPPACITLHTERSTHAWAGNKRFSAPPTTSPALQREAARFHILGIHGRSRAQLAST
jgi:hypothetical protein